MSGQDRSYSTMSQAAQELPSRHIIKRRREATSNGNQQTTQAGAQVSKPVSSRMDLLQASLLLCTT